MKKLLSLILSITMLTSVAQLSAFADITAPVGTTEDNPVSAEASLQDETEDVAEVTEDEPVLHSTLEQESAKLIALTAEETGFKLTDNSDEQANSNSDVQANTTAEQSETEPVTSQATEPDNTTNQPAGIINSTGNMLRESVSYTGNGTSLDGAVTNPISTNPNLTDDAKQAYLNESKYPEFNTWYDADKSIIMPGMRNSITKDTDGNYCDCRQMIPQGFCSADVGNNHYLLVSAYCSKSATINGDSGTGTCDDGKTHRSVIYVLDRDTREYITEIILPIYSHVGGVAYDGTQYLWVGKNYTPSASGTGADQNAATQTDGAVICFDFKALDGQIQTDKTINSTNVDGYNYKKTAITVNSVTTYSNLPIRPDAMAFDNAGNLCIARFTYNGSTQKSFTFNGNTITNTESVIAKFTVNGNSQPTYSTYTKVPVNRIQGFAYVNNEDGAERLVISRSYVRTAPTGSAGSANYISELDILEGTTVKYRLTMPSMVEGAVYNAANNRLYVTFESAGFEYLGGNSTNDPSKVSDSPCEKIAALNIDDYLNYDHIINIGGMDGTINESGLKNTSYEQFILDKDLAWSNVVTDTTDLETDGKQVTGVASGAMCLYAIPSNVTDKTLVRVRGNLDLATRYRTSATAGWTTYVGEGFYVTNTGNLTIRNDCNYRASLRRRTFSGDVDESKYFENYTADIIKVEDGGKLTIKGGASGLQFDGDNLAVTGALIRTATDNGRTSEWDIDNVTFRNILDTTSADVCGVHPYGKFSQLNITNCNFQNIKVFKNTSNDNREDAAIFFPRSYIGNKTLIQNCTFDNSGVTSVTNSVDFEAIRFQGTDADFTLDNVSFNNYTTGGYGPVGFVNYNKIKTDNTAGEHASYYKEYAQITAGRTGEIGNLTLKKVTMTNCKGANKLKDIKDLTGSKNTHYYAPLTFSKAITGTLTIEDSKFSNCEGYCAGAISFDVNDNEFANINKVLIKGTTLDKESAANNNGTPNADYSPTYFYQCQGNKNGGAIGVYGKITTFDIDKVLIDECKSTNGSAIMLQQACNIGTMSLTNSLVQKCLSQNYIDTKFNTTSDYSGTIRTQGAATCGSFTVDNCDIINNKVWNDGGGIYWNIMSDDAHMYITNSTISGNYAAQSGGGIYCEGIMTVRNSEIINNSAGNDGGGICQGVYSNSNTKGDNPIYPTVKLTNRTTNLSLESGVKVDNNFAKCCGGGVAFILRESVNIDDGSTFTLKLTMADSNSDGTDFTTPAQINNNVSGELGGGVYYGTGSEGSSLDAAAGTKGNAYTKTVELKKGTIENNQARNKGGGIYVMGNNTTVKVSNTDVISNKAGYDSCSDKSYITFTNPVVSGVTTYKMSSDAPESSIEGSSYQGGGIAIRGENSGIIVTGGSVSDNKSAVGGGIDARNGAYVNVNGGSVSNNTAGIFTDTECNAYKFQNGGGIYVVDTNNVTIDPDVNEGYHVLVNNGNVSGNKCIYRGGGIYASTNARVKMSGGDITSNSSVNDGGGIGTLKGSVEVTGGNIENNIAESGGGGAVIALGGTVTVTGGLIRYNEANGNNTNTAYHKTSEFGGIGGGICISGRDGNQASFTLSGDNIGIYGNNAEFAADDVYASGDNTKLSVPKVGDMTLSDYNGKVTGWFEDYNNNDTSYSEGTNLASVKTGSRYNSAKGSVYAEKCEIPDNNSDPSGDMITTFVNVKDKYVCMTLGTLANARISNNVFTADGKSLNGTDNTEFSYTLTSDSTLTSSVLTYEIGGFTFTPKDTDIKENKFTFTLKGGETISFPNLSENLNVTIDQTTRSLELPNVLTKTESSLNSGEFVEKQYVCSFKTDPSEEQSLVYNNYIDRYITVTLNYYNRAVVNGSPATMQSDATSVKIPVKLESKYISDGKIDTGKIIIDAAVDADSKYKFDNVIEGYCVWRSQKEASTTGIASYHNFHTGENYESSEYHTDCYGNLLNESKDSDKWVTYNNDALTENEETGKLDDTSDLSTINVWLFNYPKTYNVTYYSAPNSFSTNAEGDTFVYTEKESVLSGIYYNQRLGFEDDAEEGSGIDTLTGHLTGYGLPSVSGQTVTTASEITVSGTPYYFKGWATDEAGKVIVSTDIRYRYRVTNDITLYPVYSKSKANVGLTATAINPDIYIDSNNIARTRLNTMLNPYGCPDNDTNIKKVAIVYVTDANGALVTNNAKVQAAVQKSLADNDSKSENSGASFADKPLTVDGDTVEGTETTEKVTIGNANYFVHLVSSEDVTLTSKNRVQFTTTFKTDQLKGKTLAAFVAMKYDEEWKVSDNYINYIFDGNGEMTSSASVVI